MEDHPVFCEYIIGPGDHPHNRMVPGRLMAARGTTHMFDSIQFDAALNRLGFYDDQVGSEARSSVQIICGRVLELGAG